LHRRRDDERARSSGALRARGPRGAVLAGRAIGGVGTAAVARVRGPLASLAALSSGPAGASRASRAPAAAAVDDPCEERVVERDDDVDPAAASARPAYAAVAPVPARRAALGRASPGAARPVGGCPAPPGSPQKLNECRMQL